MLTVRGKRWSGIAIGERKQRGRCWEKAWRAVKKCHEWSTELRQSGAKRRVTWEGDLSGKLPGLKGWHER